MNSLPTHPAIHDALSALHRGKVTRRQFVQFASLLGLSGAGIDKLLGLSKQGSVAKPVATLQNPRVTEVIPYGGTWSSAMKLYNIDHPARLVQVEGGNLLRQVSEYLTEIGTDYVVRSQLVESWEASEDLKTWTLHLRQNVTFNNGDKLDAIDVLFTFGQWLDPTVGSAMLGVLSYLGSMSNVEKVDDYTIKLHLNEPRISVPEDLAYYPALVLHRNFQGNFLKQPIGTGAFLLNEYIEGERAELLRRSDYWRKGANGNSLPYLDRLLFRSLDADDALAALQSGQVDTIFQPRLQDWAATHENTNFSIQWVRTSSVFLGKMRVDLEPWNDNRVRTALKLCQDRLQINKLAYAGQGDLGIDAHIAPSFPDYGPKPIPTYDPDKAKALLQAYADEKGLTLPLKVTLATKNDLQESQIAPALKARAEPAGFEITLDITDPNGYWDRWTEVPLGITHWIQRNPSISALQLAYTADKDGKLAPWNETHWVDLEFVEQLDLANRTLDIEERRSVMSKMEDIMQARGPVFVSFWNSNWNITRSEFRNVKAHPRSFDLLGEVWKAPTETPALYLPFVAR